MQTKTALGLFALTTLSLFWVGCVAESNGEDDGATSSHLDNSNGAAAAETAPPIVEQPYKDTSLTTVKEQTPTAIPAAIDMQPANGTVFDDSDPSKVRVTFTGFALEAGQTIDVQVLTTPDSQIAEGNWETIATGTADTTPTTFGDPAPIFRYSIVAQPGANNHWDAGGILRYRTLAEHAGQPSLMPFYDAVSGNCIAKQNLTSWKDVMKLCKSPFSPNFGDKLGSTTRAAALVSSSPEPGDNLFNPPPYLSRKGFMFPSQTDDYYDIVDAPDSLEEFEERFGFFDDGAQANASYYNLGDLGIGREMHCAQFTDPDRGASTACYVKNYGVLADGTGAFSGDPDSAMDDLVGGQLNFATVAMVKFGTTFDEPRPNDVQFFVYNSTDDLVDQAQLDSVASNTSIPNNCTNCHGGNYDSPSGQLKGSTFLPFDPNSFLYSEVDGFSYEQQADQLRQLNAMVRTTGAPPGTAQFIDGTYGGKPNEANTTANLDWIPPGWSTSEESKTVYREVYKQYCRTCHTSQVGQFAFITYDDFKAAATQTLQDTCVTSQMPVCEATMGLFWRGGARAYLVNALDASSSCTPGTF